MVVVLVDTPWLSFVFSWGLLSAFLSGRLLTSDIFLPVLGSCDVDTIGRVTRCSLPCCDGRLDCGGVVPNGFGEVGVSRVIVLAGDG